MLSCSSGAKTALSASNRVFKVKVLITRNDSGANPIDISDRVISSDITHSFDSRNANANLTLDNWDFQLSPMQRNSNLNLVNQVYDPLLDAYHKIQIYEGITLSDGTVEYILKFTGYLGDEIDISSNPQQITINCRDCSKILQDRYIYQSDNFAGWLVEEIVQKLLDIYLPQWNFTVQVQSNTQYIIGRPDTPYCVQNTTLWDAVQTLSDSASQELRFMEDGSFVMRPNVLDFSTSDAVLTLNESTLVSDDMQISDADVRNNIVVKVEGQPYITVSSNASISKYGMRYMEVDRAISDIITDPTQVQTFATTMLKDLAYAKPVETSVVPLNPLIQVADIVNITNGRIGTDASTDVFKVIEVQDTLSTTSKRTTVNLKGYDIFDSIYDPAPNPPTAFNINTSTRTIQNYQNSGWTGYDKTIHYPYLTWTPPIQDVSGNILDYDFGGYVVYRDNLPLASIPSYVPALSLQINYYYDYMASGGSTHSYGIKAFNKHGVSSSTVSGGSYTVPRDVILDIHGNQLN